ncbi:polysaccharide deacetylase family protein [Streptomyces mirabilis]|uniref:polysaccharide deacetylase family protein n=1 Tax=Streptomyces mirabilis TaxID=68239 RepID=UPI00224F25DE|nr:polysaccharide deacetylase family protein [Streptomyces mirabilis]MCX4608724.1 polysaccharide deacetylase family protein [Streptomyces mirabilis]
MARRRFPEDRNIFAWSAAPNQHVLYSVNPGDALRFFLDQALTAPADVIHLDGSPLFNRLLIFQTRDVPLIPEFLGPPDGTTVLYAQLVSPLAPAAAQQAPPLLLYAQSNARLDALESGASTAAGQLAQEAIQRQAGDAATLSSANAHTDSTVANESSARSAGDAATLTSAKGYTDTAVSTEATRAQAAESTNAAVITAEATRAQGAEQANAQAISTETSARTAGDASALASAKSYADSTVATESGRAQAAEQANATAISNEQTRAQNAENSLGASVTAESNRAQAAEAQLLPLFGGSVTGDLAVTGRLTAGGYALPVVMPTGRRPAYRKATWSQQFQTGHSWTVGGSGTASSNVNDTGTFVRGTQSVRVTTAANAVQSQVRKLSQPTMDLTGKMIRLILKVDDVTHLDRLEFLIGTSTFTNYFRWTVHTHSAVSPNYVQSGEWVTVHLNWADVSASGGTYSLSANGTPNSRSGFTDMQVNCYDDGTGAVTYHLQAVELVPDTAETFPNGVITISFDDSYASVYDLARPKMDALGFSGTMFNIAEAIGSSGVYLNTTQMRSMQDFSGWEMGGHAYGTAAHAARYTTMTEQAVADDFRKLRSWMVQHGFTSEHFAYPGGQFGNTTDGVPVDQIAARYFTSARSIISENVESFPAAMPHRLKAVTGINDGTSIGGVTVSSLTATGGKLDRCLNNGDWLNLCLHKIVTGTPADSTEISQTGFNTLMDAINSRGIPVITVSEAMRFYS